VAPGDAMMIDLRDEIATSLTSGGGAEGAVVMIVLVERTKMSLQNKQRKEGVRRQRSENLHLT
jgi:hypothetical protein